MVERCAEAENPREDFLVLLSELGAVDPVEEGIDATVGESEHDEPEVELAVRVHDRVFAQHESHATWQPSDDDGQGGSQGDLGDLPQRFALAVDERHLFHRVQDVTVEDHHGHKGNYRLQGEIHPGELVVANGEGSPRTLPFLIAEFDAEQGRDVNGDAPKPHHDNSFDRFGRSYGLINLRFYHSEPAFDGQRETSVDRYVT